MYYIIDLEHHLLLTNLEAKPCGFPTAAQGEGSVFPQLYGSSFPLQTLLDNLSSLPFGYGNFLFLPPAVHWLRLWAPINHLGMVLYGYSFAL